MRKSFVINSVASCNQIQRSPLNRSPSKRLFSFSKEGRFPRHSSYCDSFYRMPSSLQNKKRGIGYGNKLDFTKNSIVSPGSKYNLQTGFENNKNTKKGYTMNLSRQKLPLHGYMGHIPLEPLKTPSPDRYQNLKLDKGMRYSLRKKTQMMDKTMTIESQNDTPGPGRYENPEALSPRGSYMLTKHRGTGATKINPRRSKRFLEPPNFTPGPGRYDEINKMSDSGYYPLSSSNGFGKRKFDKQKRVAKFESQSRKNYNPGPGSYRSSSDFGQYDGDVYHYSYAECFGYPGRNNPRNSRSKFC